MCFKCGKPGHTANQCKSGSANVMEDHDDSGTQYTLGLYDDDAYLFVFHHGFCSKAFSGHISLTIDDEPHESPVVLQDSGMDRPVPLDEFDDCPELISDGVYRDPHDQAYVDIETGMKWNGTRWCTGIEGVAHEVSRSSCKRDEVAATAESATGDGPSGLDPSGTHAAEAAAESRGRACVKDDVAATAESATGEGPSGLDPSSTHAAGAATESGRGEAVYGQRPPGWGGFIGYLPRPGEDRGGGGAVRDAADIVYGQRPDDWGGFISYLPRPDEYGGPMEVNLDSSITQSVGDSPGSLAHIYDSAWDAGNGFQTPPGLGSASSRDGTVVGGDEPRGDVMRVVYPSHGDSSHHTAGADDALAAKKMHVMDKTCT